MIIAEKNRQVVSGKVRVARRRDSAEARESDDATDLTERDAKSVRLRRSASEELSQGGELLRKVSEADHLRAGFRTTQAESGEATTDCYKTKDNGVLNNGSN